LQQPLFRREAQSLNQQGQVYPEVARARCRAAGRRVEQVFFGVPVHAR